MKKIVIAGLAAFCVMAATQQQASAWVNCRFGIGMNWQWQSGGNNFFWGAYHNGQVPGPEAFGYGSPLNQYFPPAPAPYYSYAPLPQSAPAPYASQPAPLYQFATYPRETQYYFAPPAYYYYYR
jgi:hypothetical protein